MLFFSPPIRYCHGNSTIKISFQLFTQYSKTGVDRLTIEDDGSLSGFCFLFLLNLYSRWFLCFHVSDRWLHGLFPGW